MDFSDVMYLASTSSPSDPRLTVCRDWLEGNCPDSDLTCNKGIHQYDLSRMPMCPSFQKNEMCPTGARYCIYRHHCPIECPMYKMGFCPNGPNCLFTHVRRTGSPPSIGEMIDYRNKDPHRVIAPNSEPAPQVEAPVTFPYPRPRSQPAQQVQEPATFPPVRPHLPDAPFPPLRPHFQNAPPGQHNAQFRPFGPHFQNEPVHPFYEHPWPVDYFDSLNHLQSPELLQRLLKLFFSRAGRFRYFVIKNYCPDTLRYAAKSGLWSPHHDMKDQLNDAFRTCDHVFLFFSNDKTQRFEGCAKMMSKVGDPVPGLWDDKTWEAKYIGEVFQLRWFKLCEIPTNMMAELRSRFSENEPVEVQPLIQFVVKKVRPLVQPLIQLVLEKVQPLIQVVVVKVQPLIQFVVKKVRPLVQPLIQLVVEKVQPLIQVVGQKL